MYWMHHNQMCCMIRQCVCSLAVLGILFKSKDTLLGSLDSQHRTESH